MSSMQRFGAFVLSLAAVLAATPALTQDYPKQDIRVVVGFPAGSGADVYARYFANKLAQISKATVIVENKPGANSAIATEHVRTPDRTATPSSSVARTHSLRRSIFSRSRRPTRARTSSTSRHWSVRASS